MKTMLLKALAAGLLVMAGSARLGANEAVYQKTLRTTALIVSRQGQGTGWVLNREHRQLVTCQHVVGTDKEVEVLFPAFRDHLAEALRKMKRDGLADEVREQKKRLQQREQRPQS
jgi:hypothetical protein